MRIAIVNDSVMAVEALRRCVAQGPGLEVAWVAHNGREAIEFCRRDRPDLVLMDLLMPVMDGVAATAGIMRECPCPILVVTASVGGNAGKVFEAMGAGALDAAATPTLAGGGSGARELLEKIEFIRRLVGASAPGPAAPPAPAAPLSAGLPPILALGASTGGPAALCAVLRGLSRPAPFAVLVVQHLDAQFAEGFAAWLAAESRQPAVSAAEGDRVEAGRVYVAARGEHLLMGADRRLHYRAAEADECFCPSIDRLFFSLREHWPARGAAALLTGIGRDGAAGLLRLRQAGWHTISQDEGTSVIFGMPKAAAELQAPVEVLPLERIAAAAERASISMGARK